MKKIIGLICFATLLLAGCTVKELENPQKIAGDFPIFYASFGDAADETTKTYVDEDISLRWTKDDRLSIFVGNTYNHEYKYDGETGANNGSFSAISNPEFFAAEPLEANYAVYPYNASNEMDTDGSMSIILPSVQKYAQNSFGLGANTMVAATESKEDNFLQFKNLCGYVVVKLYGEGTVTSIKLEGNDGEKISGKADVQVAYGILPSVTMSEEATTSITLDCGEGVTLGTTAETATEFWFCVPPLTFSKGFTITATKTDGWQMIKSTSLSKEVVRNTKNALTPIEGVFDIPSVEVVPPDDEIWYTTTDSKIVSLTHPVFGDSKFNANVVSNEYHNGRGIIKFDAPVTAICDGAFAYRHNLASVILPGTINEFGTGIFDNCVNLEKVVIHSESLRIDETKGNPNPFARCKKLKIIEGPLASEDGRCLIVDNSLFSFAPNGLSEYSIPQGVKTVKTAAFLDCTLKTIIIQEGVEIIEQEAFIGHSFTDEHIESYLEYVYLPSSLKHIGLYAFLYNNKNIKSFFGDCGFVSSDGMCLIDNNRLISFASGAGLSEYTIPDGVEAIGNYAFYYATSLKKLNFPDSYIRTSSGHAFEGTTNIEMITGKNVLEDNRSMVVDGKLVMYAGAGQEKYVTPKEVSSLGDQVLGFNNSIKEYVLSDEIVDADGYGYLFHQCPNLETVTISANMEYVGYDPFDSSPFCTPKLKTVYCRALMPPTAFFNDGIGTLQCQFTDLTIYVPEQSVELYKQSWTCYKEYIKGYKYDDLPEADYYISTDYSADGTVHTVQTATIGNGVNVVLMGDAFSDRQIADGTYNNVMQKAVNALFSEEPYKSYKDYFNVYTVDAVSMTEGYEHGGQVFSTGHGDGTYVYGNDNKVVEYAQKVLTGEQIDDALIIVMMNEDAYAGTCFMYYPDSGDYGRGAAIAYFPTSSDIDTFNGLVSHEAGGHGFAKLGDEYAYEDMGTISDQAISDTKQMEPYGWWKNVDFTSGPTQVKWSKFLSDERYANEGLGCFEGGLTYWSGVWRPTDYSIMRYNTGGFNAPSREAIWYRIHKLAYGEDWQYNYEDFVAYDAINRTPAAQTASRAKVKAAAAARKGKPFQPLHEPVVIKRSWKKP